MQVQVKKWGNGQGIRFTKEMLQMAEISLDDVLNVSVSDGVIRIEKAFRHKPLEERAEEYDGKLNLDGEYDFGTQVGNEVW